MDKYVDTINCWAHWNATKWGAGRLVAAQGAADRLGGHWSAQSQSSASCPRVHTTPAWDNSNSSDTTPHQQHCDTTMASVRACLLLVLASLASTQAKHNKGKMRVIQPHSWYRVLWSQWAVLLVLLQLSSILILSVHVWDPCLTSRHGMSWIDRQFI